MSNSSSSSSSDSSSNEDGAESRSLKSQQTVKEVALTEFKSEEIKINEPPEVPSTEKEQPTPTEPISATKSQSSRRDSLESTQSERDSKLAKLKNIMQESTENLAKIDDKQNQAASGLYLKLFVTLYDCFCNKYCFLVLLFVFVAIQPTLI